MPQPPGKNRGGSLAACATSPGISGGVLKTEQNPDVLVLFKAQLTQSLHPGLGP